MADFGLIQMKCNHGTQGAPVWVNIGGVATEIRWSDLDDQQPAIASANWPAMIRPAGTAAVSYTYAYTADAVGTGFCSQSGAIDCPAFSIANFLWAKWDWDALGTFASAPIFTAYPDVAHTPTVREDGTMLGGAAPDTKPGAFAFSYLKGNAYGRVDSAGIPALAPVAAPVVTSGTVGSVVPPAGANWLATFQSLMIDLDYITFPAVPAAVTADQWSVMFALFAGVGETPGIYTSTLRLVYTWT